MATSTEAETKPVLSDPLSQRVIGLAMEVHRELGPGLLESAYEQCLCYELERAGLPFRRQLRLPITYKGMSLGAEYRVDLVVADSLIVELKTVDAILPVHEAQVLTYLRLSKNRKALLLNFKAATLKDGIRRFVL